MTAAFNEHVQNT